MPTIIHPRSGEAIEGVRLPPGALVREGDKYDCTDGRWLGAGPIAGLVVGPARSVVVVRQTSLPNDAQELLKNLNEHGGDHYGCIGRRGTTFCFFPSPDFNWDSRLSTPPVEHPDCIQELAAWGYLALTEHDVLGREGLKNRVYTLTDAGKEEGARLLVLEGEADESASA